MDNDRESGFRCRDCEAILPDLTELVCPSCRGGDWKPGDVVLNPATGRVFTAEWDRYAKEFRWLEMAPAAAHAQSHPPRGAVLLVRCVDGQWLAVTDTTAGDLYAVGGAA